MIDNKYGLDLEITGLWYIPFWKSTVFYAIIISSLILLLIMLFYFFHKKRNLKDQDPAVLLIRSLSSGQDLDKIDAQSFYFSLVFKFKEFIKYKYNLVVFDKTDRELKCFLHQHKDLDGQLVNILIEILDDSYVARFTKGVINKSKMESDLQKTISVMQQIISSASR